MNPNTQINWPIASGAGAPTATCPTSALLVGTPYYDSTNLKSYTCTPTGWQPTGTQGPAGPAGPPPQAAGIWNSGQTYTQNQFVAFGPSSFVALVSNTGVTPPSDCTPTVTWGLLACGGAGNSTAIQSTPVGAALPLLGQNLSTTAGGNYLPGYGDGYFGFAGSDAFGDSTCAGNGATPPPSNVNPGNTTTSPNGWGQLVAALMGGNTSHCQEAAMAADIAATQFMGSGYTPHVSNNSASYTALGINDANSCGASSGCQYNFLNFAKTYVFGGLVPSEYKIYFGTNTQVVTVNTGTWAPDTTYPDPYTGLATSSTSGSITFSTFSASTAMYLAWHMTDGNTSTATLNCDTGAVTDTLYSDPATDPSGGVAIHTLIGITTSVATRRYTFSTSGTHSCTVVATASGGNPFTVAWAGTPMPSSTTTFGNPGGNPPREFIGGTIHFLNGAKDSTTAIYDSLVQSLVTTAAADTLQAAFIDVRNCMNDTTDMSATSFTLANGITYAGSTAAGLHANNLGYEKQASCYLAKMRPIGAGVSAVTSGAAPFTGPIVQNQPATLADISGYSKSNGKGIFSTTAIMPGGNCLLYIAGAHICDGFDEGYDTTNNIYGPRIFAVKGHDLQFGWWDNTPGTWADAQSRFTDLMIMNNNGISMLGLVNFISKATYSFTGGTVAAECKASNAATSGANVNSCLNVFTGNVWNGSVSVSESYTVGEIATASGAASDTRFDVWNAAHGTTGKTGFGRFSSGAKTSGVIDYFDGAAIYTLHNLWCTSNCQLYWPDNSGTAAIVGIGINKPVGTPTYTAGTNVTSCSQASGYTNTNMRGEITVVGGTATTGTICTLNFSTALNAAPVIQITQNGGASLYNLGHGTCSTTGCTITAGLTVVGATINLDYLILP